MKKSFLNAGEPFITEMVQVPTANRAVYSIQNAIADGATAIGLQLGHLHQEDRTEANYARIVAACEGRPIYLTNYRDKCNAGKTDEELMQELLAGLSWGATLLDVMGDTFDPAPEELTTDENAIKKQMEFIDEVHKRGGEVLMSSHIKKFRPAERVVEMALEHQRRGADVVKIVTGADTQEEELANLEICNLLKKELKVPFLFLSSGKYNYLHRTVGPALGVCMWLCFREYNETTYGGPPLLSNVLKIKQGLKL